jgi:hypothetical protein
MLLRIHLLIGGERSELVAIKILGLTCTHLVDISSRLPDILAFKPSKKSRTGTDKGTPPWILVADIVQVFEATTNAIRKVAVHRASSFKREKRSIVLI